MTRKKKINATKNNRTTSTNNNSDGGALNRTEQQTNNNGNDNVKATDTMKKVQGRRTRNRNRGLSRNNPKMLVHVQMASFLRQEDRHDKYTVSDFAQRFYNSHPGSKGLMGGLKMMDFLKTHSNIFQIILFDRNKSYVRLTSHGRKMSISDQKFKKVPERNGAVRYGSNEMQQHTVKANVTDRKFAVRHGNNEMQQHTVKASKDILKFCNRLEQIECGKKKGTTKLLMQPDMMDLWFRSWNAAATGALTFNVVLISTLLSLPASATMLPPTADIIPVLIKTSKATNLMNSRQESEALNMLEMVVDCVCNRMRHSNHQGSSISIELVNDLSDSLRRSISSWITRGTKQLKRCAAILSSIESGVELCRTEVIAAIKAGPSESLGIIDVASSNLHVWKGWQRPKLCWLLEGSFAWLQAPQLQKKYESIEDYADTLQRMMTMLTFYWGAGAVWPKCRKSDHAESDKCCNQPILSQVRDSSKLKCCSRLSDGTNCTNHAHWQCPLTSHLYGFCNRCVRKDFKCQTGKPTHVRNGASTDIYDAEVEYEQTRRDGQVYILCGVESRRPPQISPNWKTTYRLQCSGLIAIMNLNASHEALSPEQEIYWAQVVAVDEREQKTDANFRSKGKMAVRMLSRGDLSALDQASTPTLNTGNRIAIIDLRVFVPEVIPVLSSCCDHMFSEHLAQIPFSGQLIGNKGEQTYFDVENNEPTEISEMIHHSNVEVIQRLSPESQNRLAQDLSKVVKNANLRGAQLNAFSAALMNPIHCIQGPPGTGKSYVGVQIAFALDRVRTEALAAGHSVGPILILSYKNHALDEILLDVIDGLKTNKNSTYTRDLIRCGNPENERLLQYKEKRSPLEAASEKKLGTCLSIVRRSRNIVSAWLDLAGYLELTLLTFPKDSKVSNANVTKVLKDWNIDSKVVSNDASRIVVSALELLHIILSEQNASKLKKSDKAYQMLESLVANKCNQDGLLNVICGLKDSSKHWIAYNSKNYEQLHFITAEWLCGNCPPPLCRAAEEFQKDEDTCNLPALSLSPYCKLHECCYQKCLVRRIGDNCIYCPDHCCKIEACIRLRLGNFHFCQKHLCTVCLSSDLVPGNPKCNDTQICAQHRCSIEDCHIQRISFDSVFCKKHSCLKCFDNGCSTQVDMRCVQSRLCNDHRCSNPVTLCPNIRADKSCFCQSHTCRFCIRKIGHASTPVMDGPPRNTCVEHQLCSFMQSSGQQCLELAIVDGGLYCSMHQVKNMISVTCSGITKKKKNCRTKGKAPIDCKQWYCTAHEDQAPDHSSCDEEMTDNDSNLSSAITSTSYEWDLSSFSESDDDSGSDLDTQLKYVKLDCDNKIFSGSTKEHEIKPSKPSSNGILDLQHQNQEKPCLTYEKDDGTINKVNTAVATEIQNVTPPDLGHFISDNKKQAKVAVESCPEPNREPDPKPKFEAEYESKSESKLNLNPKLEPEVQTEFKLDLEIIQEGNVSYGEVVIDSEFVEPDEMDFVDVDEDDDDEHELDTNDNQQRLHDMLGSSSESEGEEEFIWNEKSNQTSRQNLSACSLGNKVSSWSWDMSLHDRWKSVAILLIDMGAITKALLTSAEDQLDKARREKAEAAAEAFQSSRIIGATVAGAAKRFQALRAAEPFAVIVEEACEVMEPLLMSIITLRSLKKLELIGDHRQLPAFIQSCWFNLEKTHRSIKMSLFERLVETASDSVLCHVLDEQRRMRPEIADLTRECYADVVDIKDNECTIHQRVGDVFLKSNPPDQKKFNSCKELWSGEGRVIPGVIPQVFFWELENNKESRPISGLSACNDGEADAVASIVRWCLICGVPPSSISVISPYKGQTRLISRKLKNVPGALKRNIPSSKSVCRKNYDRGQRQGQMNNVVNQVIVSTVDRYQGDENDIVILSLVRARPGNRFVALQNRFIVAASRARIGFYIVGSSRAVTLDRKGNRGPLHWCSFVKQLHTKEKKLENESSDHDKLQMKSESSDCNDLRIGSSIPICCPRHNQSRCNVKNANMLMNMSPASLCIEPCAYVLDWCGHQCGVKCHDIYTSPHTMPNKCQKEVLTPCSDHSDKTIFCGDVYKQTSMLNSVNNIQSALKSFVCNIPIIMERKECEHTSTLPCGECKEIKAGHKTLGNCLVQVDDYFHPVCNHSRKNPICFKRREWEASPPKCYEDVTHTRACGCSSKIKCWQQQEERITPTQCNRSVRLSRPRCFHKLSIRCHEASRLRQKWDIIADELKGNSARKINSNDVLVEHSIVYGPSETEIGRQLANFPIILECNVNASYQAACSHISKVPCAHAFEWAMGVSLAKERSCNQLVSTKSPICGQTVQAPCHLINSKAWKDFPILHFSDGSLEMVEISEVVLSEAPHLSETIFRVLSNQCFHSIQVQRKCGHIIQLPCSNILKRSLPLCKELVTKPLQCGHTTSIKCHSDDIPLCMAPLMDKFTFSCGKHSIQPGVCHKISELRMQGEVLCPENVSCVRYRCGHTISAPCHMKEQIESSIPGNQLPTNTEKIVIAGMDYCEELGLAGLCEQSVLFRGLCGHNICSVPCHKAFKWAEGSENYPPCKQEEIIESPLCNHVLHVPCSVKKIMHTWKPWTTNTPWEPVLRSFDGEDVLCPELNYDMVRPVPPPQELNCQLIRCNYKSIVNLACGHSLELACVDAFNALDAWDCKSLVTDTCVFCRNERQISCSEKQRQDRSGVRDICKKIVSKSCQVCQLTFVEIPCHRHNIQCNKRVSVELECGHEVSWKCGEDLDPRKNPKSCKACLLRQLDSIEFMLQSKESNINLKLMSLFQRVVSKKIPQDLMISARADIECKETNERNIGILIQGQLEIISRFKDLLSDSNASTSFPPNPLDEGQYDIVFVLIKQLPSSDNIINKIKSVFQPKQTRYGRGSKLTLLSTSSILPLFEGNKTNNITICVGVAFRHKVLTGSPPFLGKKRGRQQVKKANKMSMMKKESGYDCVLPASKAKAKNDCIYWVPGVCVPITIVSLQQSYECLVCFDRFQSADGLWCRGEDDHFLCNSCFSDYVKVESNADFDLLEKRKGRILCVNGCDAPYSDADVAQHVSEKIFNLYNEAMKKLIEHRLAKEIRVEERHRLEEEQKQLALMSEFQRKVYDVRRHIVEELLTLKCPRCRQAFVDFTGCYALTCGQCNCGFCAWCLKDCNNDAHSHVATCPENPGVGYYGTLEAFNHCQIERRKRMVRNYLQTVESAEVQKLAVVQCKMELEDLNMLEIVQEFNRIE